ncbi:MAG: hypothetical protein NTU53_23875 [Planctomycetota bacterium]|nr:hypothetical protein [Planctomycetota bacterium]
MKRLHFLLGALLSALWILGLLNLPAQASVRYTLTDLGDLPGENDYTGDYSSARAISNRGQIVGWSDASDGQHALRWNSAGVMEDLTSVLPPGGWSSANAINQIGQVAGYATFTSPGRHAFLLTPGAEPQDLGAFGGWNDESYALGINDVGHVVGISMTNYGERGFVWTPETGLRDLGWFPGGVYHSNAAGINNAGQAVGGVGTLTGDWRAFIWTSATGMQDLGSLDSLPIASANAVNEDGLVAGYVARSTGSSAIVHAALWKPDGAILDLGVLPGGDEYSTALALNNFGQIVGEATVGNDNRAFLWTAEEGMLDLNNLLQTPSEGWTLLKARGINDLGQIVGEAKCPTGTHAFLLAPIPEPAGLALLAVCVLGFLRQRGTYQLDSSWSRCGTAQNTTEITNRRSIHL